MTTVWGSALVVASGVTLSVLGIWAFTLKPRTTTTRAFGTYGLGTGAFLAIAWSAFAWPDVPGLPSIAQGSPVILPVAVVLWTSVILLVLGVPRPLHRDERRLLVRPALVGVGFFVLVLAGDAIAPSRGVPTLTLLVNAGNWGVTFAAIGIALERSRAANGPDAVGERRHLALVATALCLIIGEATGRIGLAFGGIGQFGVAFPLASSVVVLGLAAAWLRLAASSAGPSARHARDVALVLLAAWVFGGAWQAWGGDGPAAMGSLGIAILAGGVLLARGALVGDLLGADVQLRWGISKSTIAGAFIAVFFVGSEAAQQFLGETLGSTYVGIAAAGMLVFAIAPLQRAAERLAEKAVPVTAPQHEAAPASSADPDVEVYRRAARLALRDRHLTREEEVHLFDLAHRLRIPPSVAVRIHEEIQREPGADP